MALKDILLKDGKLTTGAKIGAGAIALGTGIALLTKKKKDKTKEQPEEPVIVASRQPPPEEKKSNTGLIVGIVVGVLVITGVGIYLVTRKK
jgi:hypothetical protein